MDPPAPSLDDPVYAAFAWSRFRRMLAWMALASAACAGGCWWWIDATYGPLGWIATLALLGGAFATVFIAGVLMGLAFLSSGSGHDEAVQDFEPPR